jgi:hypothetical protein
MAIAVSAALGSEPGAGLLVPGGGPVIAGDGGETDATEPGSPEVPTMALGAMLGDGLGCAREHPPPTIAATNPMTTRVAASRNGGRRPTNMGQISE